MGAVGLGEPSAMVKIACEQLATCGWRAGGELGKAQWMLIRYDAARGGAPERTCKLVA